MERGGGNDRRSGSSRGLGRGRPAGDRAGTGRADRLEPRAEFALRGRQRRRWIPTSVPGTSASARYGRHERHAVDRRVRCGSPQRCSPASARPVALLMFLNVAIIAMTLVTPLLTGWAVERIDAGDLTGIDGAFAAAVAIALAGLLTATFSAAAGVINSRVSAEIETDLRSRLYRQYQIVDPRVLDSRPTGDLVSLASTDLVPIAAVLRQPPRPRPSRRRSRWCSPARSWSGSSRCSHYSRWPRCRWALRSWPPTCTGPGRSCSSPAARWERSRRRCRRPSPGRRPCAPTHASQSSASTSPAPPSGCWTHRWP